MNFIRKYERFEPRRFIGSMRFKDTYPGDEKPPESNGRPIHRLLLHQDGLQISSNKIIQHLVNPKGSLYILYTIIFSLYTFYLSDNYDDY